MSEMDVWAMRIVQQAYSLARSVAQDVQTRAFRIVPLVGGEQVFADVAAARSWLAHSSECGRYGRRCLGRYRRQRLF